MCLPFFPTSAPLRKWMLFILTVVLVSVSSNFWVTPDANMKSYHLRLTWVQRLVTGTGSLQYNWGQMLDVKRLPVATAATSLHIQVLGSLQIKVKIRVPVLKAAQSQESLVELQIYNLSPSSWITLSFIHISFWSQTHTCMPPAPPIIFCQSLLNTFKMQLKTNN